MNVRDKGIGFERDTANRWRAMGFDMRRQPGSGAMHWKGDLYCHEYPELHLECKAVERLNIEKAMDKAREECKVGQIVVLVHKRNRKPPLVTVEEADFVGLLKELAECRARATS